MPASPVDPRATPPAQGRLSFGARLDAHNGLGPGFDFLRISLAGAIVLTHAWLHVQRAAFEASAFWFAEYALVPMFFALSGFLVAASAMRLSLGNFLVNRGLRILPALAVDVVVCALIIGPVTTSAPLKRYFTDPWFFRYFLNITGWIHYDLPGVFRTHANTRVNGALWTVPYEMWCYAIMSGLIATRLIRKPEGVIALAVLLVVAGLASEGLAHTGLAAKLLRGAFVERGSQLLLAFIMGVIAFQLRYKIPYSLPAAALCAGLFILAAFGLNMSALNKVPNRIVLIPALAYLTVFIGLTKIPLPKIFHNADYSYGIYLYHDPLLQVVIGLVPAWVLAPVYGPFILFAIGLPAVALLASLSWHGIEKPILSLRRRFSFVARVRGVEGVGESLVDAPPQTP